MKENRVITGKESRLDHPAIENPRDPFDNGTPRYGATVIIRKDDRISLHNVNRAIQEAYNAGKAKLRGPSGKVPPLSKLKTPLRDGDKEKADSEAYENSYFINAYNSHQPKVVDRAKQELDTSEVYAGMYARVMLDFYAYRHGDNAGITCSLIAIQKTKDGERLDDWSAVEDFPDDDEDDEDEDEDNEDDNEDGIILP